MTSKDVYNLIIIKLEQYHIKVLKIRPSQNISICSKKCLKVNTE